MPMREAIRFPMGRGAISSALLLKKAGGLTPVQFGFTLKPDHTIERTLALTRQAEAAGFSYGWLFDSHVLWRDPYPLLTLMAEATTTLRLGTCVTNPATREPSVTASALAVLQELSGGRMDLGIGRGDSARRVLGKGPTSMKDLEEAVHVIRALVEGRSVEFEGTTLELTWTPAHRLPVWIAGYGPVALKLTGRVADGAMLQIADPDLIRWFVSQVRASALEAGRDPGAVSVMAAAPAHVDDVADGRDRIRWFPALVGNHVVDLVNRYQGELPESLTRYIRGRKDYDYHHHAEIGSDNAEFVTDDIVDRFGIVGDVDAHIAKLRELAEAGVDQFNVYLMNGDEEEQLEIYGREVIPALRDIAAVHSSPNQDPKRSIGR
jgi:probable F420-dependent oxidoreductase